MDMSELAINGGTPVRTKPYPTWPQQPEQFVSAVAPVIQSGKWWYGERVREFERAFAHFHEAEYGIAVANGTVALEVALRAAGVRAGHEVIVPPYTFIASASAVLNIGAIPVFADIEADSLNLDPASVRRAVTPRTKAVLPVHTGGTPADMDAVIEVAQEADVAVVEDAAQAHGAEWRGRKVGALGTAGTFSFQHTKNMTAAEGGIVLTNDPEVADLCFAFHNCGRRRQSEWYEHPVLGSNFRMTEMQAALLLAQMRSVEQQMATRDQNVHYLFSQVKEVEGLRPVQPDPRVTRSAWHVVRLRFDPDVFAGVSKKRLCNALRAEGIPAADVWTEPLYAQESFKRVEETAPAAFIASGNTLDYSQVRCPVAERAGETVFGFLHQNFLGDRKDMDDIVAALRKLSEHKDQLIEKAS